MGRKELADFILRQMGKRKLNMTDLAKQSRVSRGSLYKITKCEVEASDDTLRRLSLPLGVHNSVLFGLLHSDYIRPLTREGRAEKYKGYDSGWVHDVTCPDNALVSTNQRFIKIWDIQNVGKKPWKGFSLVNTNDPSFPGYLKPEKTYYPLPEVQPGETIRIEIEFKAPPVAGTVISRWKMVDADGKLVFPDKAGIWCQVEVVDV